MGSEWVLITVKSCAGARRNMALAGTHAHVIREYLAEECADGRIVGPLDPGNLPTVQINKFGVIPKSSGGGGVASDCRPVHTRR
jgi:hypothetical protein